MSKYFLCCWAVFFAAVVIPVPVFCFEWIAVSAEFTIMSVAIATGYDGLATPFD
jgi:hypothetical protein